VAFTGGAETAGEYCYHYHTQVEDGEMASSPIYTNGAVATRTADPTTYTLPAALATALSTAGTMFVEFDYAGAGSAAAPSNRCAATLYTAGSNRMVIYNGSGRAAAIYATNASSHGYVVSAAPCDANTIVRAAGFALEDNVRLSVNGGAVGTDTAYTPPATFTMLAIGGAGYTAGTELFGGISHLMLWTHALSDAELQAVKS